MLEKIIGSLGVANLYTQDWSIYKPSVVNHQFHTYYSYKSDPDPQVLIHWQLTGAPWDCVSSHRFQSFQVSWKKLSPRMHKESLVVPFWPNQAWFFVIFKMLMHQFYWHLGKHLLHLPPTTCTPTPHLEEDRFTRLSLSRFLTKNSRLSEKATSIIEASWRSSARQRYQGQMYKFSPYCLQKNISPA